MQAPRGKQLKISGNIVNVTADVNNTVNMLPRLPNQMATTKVNLKRALRYKSSTLSLNVRPHKVVQVAKWLIDTSILYKREGITLNPDWNHNSLHETDTEQNQENADYNASTNRNENLKQTAVENEDNWSEDDVEIPTGVTDTLLTAPDFLEDTERQNVLNVAPGEGNAPLNIFKDMYSEELAYLGVFLGQPRTDNKNRLVSIYYSDICKSELRRSDRRAARCVENIFFKTKKLQMKILLGKAQIGLRKFKGSSKNLTAGQLKEHDAIEKLVHHDEGYKFLRALRFTTIF